MNKKEDFNFEWLPGFREMMACQNSTITGKDEQSNTIQNDKLINSDSQMLPPEQLQQEEQQYWKDYEYLIQLLPVVAREVWLVTDALLDQYEYTGR